MDKAKLKDTLRAGTLGGTYEFRKKIVEYKGMQVEMRQPSLNVRRKIRKLAETQSSDNGQYYDHLAFMIYSIIYCAYVPNTDELIYDEADFDSLAAAPTGDFVDKFANIASVLLDGDADEVKKP